MAYFSRSGNTRVVAGLIQRTLLGDGFSMQAEQERKTMEQVMGWLKNSAQ